MRSLNDSAPGRHILATWPLSLLVTLLMSGAIPFGAGALALGAARWMGVRLDNGFNLPFLYAQHGLQLALALLCIAALRRAVPVPYVPHWGLRWPSSRTYVGPAVLWGVFFGLLMTVVGFAPNWWAGQAPKLDYPLSLANVAGWLGFECVYVGPTEEIPFRGLMVSYLAATMPEQRARLGRYEMNQAGVIVALIFALSHVGSFWTAAWPLALAQQIYAFALGVLYAYWLEKSGSVLAPSIGHNVGDGVAYILMFIWVAVAS